MGQVSYALDNTGEKQVNLQWGFNYSNLHINFDGMDVGQIATRRDLEAGQSFTLGDGSILYVVLEKNASPPMLTVLYNNRSLPGVAHLPQNKLKEAYKVIYFVGAVSLILGIASIVMDESFLVTFGVSFLDAIVGVIFLVLGYLVSQRVLMALYAAIGLYMLLMVLSLIFASRVGGNPVSIIIARGIFLAAMYQGIAAIKALEE